jgi:AcrR family transcriptional regulator
VNVRQRRAAATRQQLLTAASAVFQEEGYTSASVGAITDRADTAHGTFYLYFRNKEDAFCEVMEEVVLDELAATITVPEGTPPEEVVERVVRGFLQAYQARWRLWRAALQAALVSKRVQDLWLNLRRFFLQRMTALIDAELARGACRALDPAASANALTSMIEGFAFVHFGLHGPMQPGRDGEGHPGADRPDSRDGTVGRIAGEVKDGGEGREGDDGQQGREGRDGRPDGDRDGDPIDHAVDVLTDLWRHAVYGRLPV